MLDTETEIKLKTPSDTPCKDFDSDCGKHSIFASDLACWLYAPERGYCPLLIQKKE